MDVKKTEAVIAANTALNDAGLPNYTELVGLIRAAERLGLTFSIGSAYISRAYIDAQEKLNSQISAMESALVGTSTVSHGDFVQSH